MMALMDRPRQSPMELHDIECRSCNMPWSIPVNNNSRWPNSCDRGAHNFHFRKISRDRFAAKAIEQSKSTGRSQFSMKVVPDI